jgi:hypothetical protein
MTVVYLLNIVAALVLPLWPIWFARSQVGLGWINPISIATVMGVPILAMITIGGPMALLDGGLFHVGYQYALLMANVLALMQFAGAVYFFRLSRSFAVERYLPFQHVRLERGDLLRGAVFFLLVFAAAMYLLASAEFGVVNWILNPREGYQLYRIGHGHWYALATSALAASVVLAFLGGGTVGTVLLATVFYVGLGYFLGSKGVLIAIFATAMIFFWFLRWRLLPWVMIVGTPLVFLLMVWNFYLSTGDAMELESITSYFSHLVNGAEYYRAYLNNEVGLFHGEVALSSLWTYVPRALMPDKPMVYGVTLINDIYFPGGAEATNTPAFAGAVEQHADFGPIGVVVFGFLSATSILTGLLSYLIFRKPGLRMDRITLGSVVLVLVQYAPHFGNFMPTGIYLIMLSFVLAALVVLRRPGDEGGEAPG